MSVRTGILRVATVIRGFGWLVAAGSLAVGIGTGVAEGWQYPQNPFDVFDNQTPKSQFDDLIPKGQPQAGAKYRLLEDNLPATDKPYVKEFAFGNMELSYIFAGLVIGAALLGLAYTSAWVLVGFAPGN